MLEYNPNGIVNLITTSIVASVGAKAYEKFVDWPEFNFGPNFEDLMEN